MRDREPPAPDGGAVCAEADNAAYTDDAMDDRTDDAIPDSVEAYTVQEADRGRRLDVWLMEQREGLSRTAAARLCEEGRVRRDGRPLLKNTRLGGGETITVSFPPPEPMEAVPQDIPLAVVYEDADVIVVNKPAGLVVHPAPGHPDGTLVNALLYHCGGALSGIGGVLRPGIVHRIDRDTSGLMIAAKNDAAHQALAAQLQDHTLARTYRCIVTGRMREEAGTVDVPVGRSRTDRKRMAVYPAFAAASRSALNAQNFGPALTQVHSAQVPALPTGIRRAVTHWRVVEPLRGGTDVECRLETGRTHQIRVHMAYLGHPVLGDPVYGRAVPGLTGQCLHATGLRFLHPRTGEAVELWCDLPEEYVRMLGKMRE